MARGAAPSLTDLVGIGAAPRWDADTADAMYALSDALFAYLYRREPAVLGAYLQALGDEPPGEPSAARRMELFVTHFGDPAAVERRLLLELR